MPASYAQPPPSAPAALRAFSACRPPGQISPNCDHANGSWPRPPIRERCRGTQSRASTPSTSGSGSGLPSTTAPSGSWRKRAPRFHAGSIPRPRPGTWRGSNRWFAADPHSPHRSGTCRSAGANSPGTSANWRQRWPRSDRTGPSSGPPRSSFQRATGMSWRRSPARSAAAPERNPTAAASAWAAGTGPGQPPEPWQPCSESAAPGACSGPSRPMSNPPPPPTLPW